jgi:hypothetical protein
MANNTINSYQFDDNTDVETFPKDFNNNLNTLCSFFVRNYNVNQFGNLNNHHIGSLIKNHTDAIRSLLLAIGKEPSTFKINVKNLNQVLISCFLKSEAQLKLANLNVDALTILKALSMKQFDFVDSSVKTSDEKVSALVQLHMKLSSQIDLSIDPLTFNSQPPLDIIPNINVLGNHDRDEQGSQFDRHEINLNQSTIGSIDNSSLESVLKQLSDKIDSNMKRFENKLSELNIKIDNAVQFNDFSTEKLGEIETNVYRNLTKLKKLNNHQHTIDFHLRKCSIGTQSAPRTLDYCNFPPPFWPHDEKFIDKYNKLIERFQTDIMHLITAQIVEKQHETEDCLNKVKNSLKNHLTDSSNFFSGIQKKVDADLQKYLKRSQEKCQKTVLSKLVTTTKLHSNSTNMDDSIDSDVQIITNKITTQTTPSKPNIRKTQIQNQRHLNQRPLNPQPTALANLTLTRSTPNQKKQVNKIRFDSSRQRNSTHNKYRYPNPSSNATEYQQPPMNNRSSNDNFIEFNSRNDFKRSTQRFNGRNSEFEQRPFETPNFLPYRSRQPYRT